MKRGTDREAEILGQIMPVITCDIFPPADILNRILSEFITARPSVACCLTPTIFKVNVKIEDFHYHVKYKNLHLGFRNSTFTRSAKFGRGMDTVKPEQFHS